MSILYQVKKNLLKLIPDKTYLKLKYRKKMGKKLNLENPQTFNEKMQWLKLNDRKEIYTKMVDKYEAKKYVADIIGEEYVIPTLGVYNAFDEIDFDKLPDQFVLKCTHDSGGLAICRNKEKFNIEEAKKKISKSLKKNYYYGGREWPYKNVKPRIIAEKYMKDSNTEQLVDYKFFCFNGEPKFIYISKGLEDHQTAQMAFLDMNFEREKFKRTDYKDFEVIPPKPQNFEKMKEIARMLSKGLIFIRVDLYEINNRIYFSELTFTPCAGFLPFDPKEYDRILGNLIDLNRK